MSEEEYIDYLKDNKCLKIIETTTQNHNHSIYATKFYSMQKQIDDRDKEIERLKEQLELYKVAEKDHEDLMKEMRKISNNVDLKLEIERLNNIINELEKWLEKEQVNSVDLDEWTIIQVRDKILELKGDSSNEKI